VAVHSPGPRSRLSLRDATKSVPPEWQRELALATGERQEGYTWLHLYWWEGEPWQKIQRWSIWEMFPPSFLSSNPRHAAQFAPVLAALEGPPPRDQRIFAEDGSFLRSEATVTQDQWDLYQETGCFARPFWVIQGDRGGHKFQLSVPEAMLCRLHGLEGETPRPGDLPYAPWDSRVRDALLEQRRLYEAGRSGVPVGATREEAYCVSRKDREQWFRTQLLAWLKPQVRQQVEENDSVLKALDLPVGEGPTDEELEAAEEQFITETSHD